MTKELYVLLAVLAGVVLTVQSGINAQLNSLLVKNNAVLSALISFLVGTVALIAILLITSPKAFQQIPIPNASNWWKFIGGLLGALYVTAIIITFPKLGAATTLSLVIAGQLVFAVIFDHFGWLGFAVKHINLYRILGVAMIIGGVLLVRKF
jgi:bacterial/archaeal transporter family-2 protein